MWIMRSGKPKMYSQRSSRPLEEECIRLKAENAELYAAIDTEVVNCHLGTLESFPSPKHAIAAIARWHYDLGVSGVCETPPEQEEV